MRINNDILESGKSMTSSFATNASEIDLCYGYAVYLQCPAGESPSGTFNVQGTVFPSYENGRTRDDGLSSVDWVNVGSAVPVEGGAIASLVNFDAQYYKEMRVKYTVASGTSTAYVRVYKKGP